MALSASMLVRSVMTSTMMVMGRPTRVGSTVAAWPVITPAAGRRAQQRRRACGTGLPVHRDAGAGPGTDQCPGRGRTRALRLCAGLPQCGGRGAGGAGGVGHGGSGRVLKTCSLPMKRGAAAPLFKHGKPPALLAVAQLPAQDLAHRGLGQLGAELDHAGPLVARKVVVAEVAHGLFGEAVVL